MPNIQNAMHAAAVHLVRPTVHRGQNARVPRIPSKKVHVQRGKQRTALMRNEAEFKRIFCRSIREVGGYTIRLAAPTISGIPDLYCIYPGYMPVLLEAKFLGELGDSFCRKIPYTLLQLHWLEETNKAQPHSSYGLIGFKYKKETYAVLTPSSQTYIRNDFLKENVYCTYDPKMGIDVKKLFTKSKIPKMGKARLLRTLDCDTMGDESTRGF